MSADRFTPHRYAVIRDLEGWWDWHARFLRYAYRIKKMVIMRVSDKDEFGVQILRGDRGVVPREGRIDGGSPLARLNRERRMSDIPDTHLRGLFPKMRQAEP